MPQPPQYLILWHSLLFGNTCVKRSYHLCTRCSWCEAMCPSICVRDGTVVPLGLQCKNDIGSGQCSVEEEDLRY